jgi:energy-coupling factor transport system ATP-binding protein
MGIKVRDLRFSYPEREVLKGISFDVEDGDFLGITGPTGCGKTTLAYTLNGLIPHAIKGRFSGCVEVFGLDTRRHRIAEMARKIGFVFQDPDWQIFSLSVKDEVEFGLRNLGMGNREERIRRALSEMGLSGYAESLPHKLSHGQKQKLCIASVLAMEPDVIVLDEPTSQLDHRSTMGVYSLLKELNRKGKTIIVIEHNTDLLSKHANKVLVMDDGKIALSGKAKDVFRKRSLLSRLGIKIPGEWG